MHELGWVAHAVGGLLLCSDMRPRHLCHMSTVRDVCNTTIKRCELMLIFCKLHRESNIDNILVNKYARGLQAVMTR